MKPKINKLLARLPSQKEIIIKLLKSGIKDGILLMILQKQKEFIKEHNE